MLYINQYWLARTILVSNTYSDRVKFDVMSVLAILMKEHKAMQNKNNHSKQYKWWVNAFQ